MMCADDPSPPFSCTRRYADGLGRLGGLLQRPLPPITLHFLRAQAYELANLGSIPLFQYTRDIYVLRSESWNNSCKKITQLPVCEHKNADSSVHWSGHTV